MQPNIFMLFGNFLDDDRITNSRLHAFGKNLLSHLIAANTNHEYDTIISLVTLKVNDFGKDLGEVDTSTITGFGKRKTNDELLASFKKTMSDEEPFIARKLGIDSTNYLDFYPHKISEYSDAAKIRMYILTNRVNVAAVANATALGEPLTTTLKSFFTDWEINRTAQETQKGVVHDHKGEAVTTRKALEIAILTAVHTVGLKFPGDVASVSALFDFTLLFPVTRHKQIDLEGTIEKETIKVLANRLFTDTATITFSNTGINADLQIYLSGTIDGLPTRFAITVKPGQSSVIKPSHLGDLKNPFLLINNTSTINSGSYKLEILG